MKTVELATAKKLKEAGFKETENIWINEISIINPKARVTSKVHLISFRMLQTNDLQRLINKETYPAPTLDELLEEMPYQIRCKREHHDHEDLHYFYLAKTEINFQAMYQLLLQDAEYSIPLCIAHPNPAEAVAQLYLQLKSEGLIK